MSLPQAFSPLLKDKLNLHDSCLFNPSIVHLSELDRTLLMSFRTFTREGTPCVTSGQPGGQWHQWLHGGEVRIGFGLVVLHRPSAGRARVLSSLLINASNLEDARLFLDPMGRIRMMFNRFFPPLATGHIRIAVQEVRVEPATHSISLGHPEQVGLRCQDRATAVDILSEHHGIMIQFIMMLLPTPPPLLTRCRT